MPWQTAPGVVIIIGAFTLTGVTLPVVHWLVKGKKRVVGRDEFDFMMEKRDALLKSQPK